MLKRRFSLALAIILCLSSFTGISVLAADEDDTPIYEVIDYYVPNEKETDYDEIRYAAGSKNYPDLEEYEERRVNILSALGFAEPLTKEENFEPKASITRGEFAAMVGDLVNAKDYAEGDKIWFTDVLADNENFAKLSGTAALGIISGYSDGTFRPENPISYDEAIAVIMKALGYRVAAEVKGGWSVGYKSTANQVGLTDGIEIEDETSISRIEAVELIYNALDCPVFRGVSYGAEVRYEADRNHTVLTEYHKIHKIRDYVNATLVSSMSGYSPTDSTHIIIGDMRYSVKKNDYVEFLGYYVEAYYKDNGKDGRDIVYLIEDEDAQKIVLKAENISDFKDLAYYYGDKNKKAVINKNHILIVNGKRLTEYEEADFVPENGDVTLLESTGDGYDTVIINTFHSFILDSAVTDRDNYVVFQSQYKLPSFSIDVNNEEQAFVMYIDDRKVDFYAEHRDIYNADGILLHQIVIPKLPYNSVLNIFADKYKTVLGKQIPADDATFIKVVVSTQKVHGKTASYGNDRISIESEGKTTEYKLSKENVLNLNKLNYKLGIEGYFLYDYDGKVFAYSTSDGEAQYIMGSDGKKILVGDSNLDVGLVYGYLITTAETGTFENRLEAKILDMNGEINVYPFAEKVEFNDEPLSDTNKIQEELNKSAKLIDPKFEISQLVKYQLTGDNKIIKIQTARQSVGAPEDASKDVLKREHARGNFNSRWEFGWNLWQTEGTLANVPLYNGEARLYFKVPNTETFKDEDYTVPVSWWPNNTKKTIDIYDCDESLVPNVVIEYDEPTGGEYQYPYVMVKNVEKGLDEEGNTVDILHFVGLAGDPVLDNPYTFEERRRKPGEEEDTLGGEARFYAETDGLFDGLVCGDLIKIYGKNRRIVDWDMVLSLEDAKNYDLSEFPKKAADPREKWDMYEAYSVIEATRKILMLQKGKLTADGKREYMQLTPFGANSYHGMILYDATGKKPNVTFWDNPHILEQARQVGNVKASRVYVWETNVVVKLLVGYVGLE